jgi:hypothetical protein
MSGDWIFQCDPKRFDIDGYLAQNDGQLSWLVARYKEQITIGDRVYLWRSGDDGGIVGEAEIAGAVETRLDDPNAEPFWLDKSGLSPAPRVHLGLKRVANKREVIRRKWLKDDHELRDLLIMRMASGTNFPVAPELAPKLFAIWSNAGRNWSYAEVVAAMWAYAQVWDQDVSKKQGSPVDQVSRLVNRVISGVYNKLMNLRALDPRVEAKGFEGGSKVDEQVWAEFYDTGSQAIRTDAINRRFRELWEAAASPIEVTPKPDETALREALDDEVSRLEGALQKQSYEALLALYASKPKKTLPKRRSANTNAFDRDPLVVVITKRRALYKCEIAECAAPTFLGREGKPYVETHHLVPLAEGGIDTPENTACLCAIHHRELHCGKNRVALTMSLQAIRTAA